MRYNTKQLFQNAAQVVASEFGNLYSEGEEVPRRRTGKEGSPEFPSKRPGAKDKSIKQQIKEAFIEAGQGDYMKAYRNTLTTLENAQRNRPRFANAKIYMGQSKPGMARGSSFGAISEADPEKLLKENRTRMKDFVISKAYLKA
jgi:hypothetical protein